VHRFEGRRGRYQSAQVDNLPHIARCVRYRHYEVSLQSLSPFHWDGILSPRSPRPMTPRTATRRHPRMEAHPGTRLSNDGQWLAYRVMPAQGDAEVVIRNLKDGKEQHFPAEIPWRPPAKPHSPFPKLPDGWRSTHRRTPKRPRRREAKKPIPVESHAGGIVHRKESGLEKKSKFAFSGRSVHRLALQSQALPTRPPARTRGSRSRHSPPDKPTGTRTCSLRPRY